MISVFVSVYCELNYYTKLLDLFGRGSIKSWAVSHSCFCSIPLCCRVVCLVVIVPGGYDQSILFLT